MNPVNLTFSHRYLSTMILVNFVMQFLEIFISLSVLGATYTRQIISLSQPKFNGLVDLDSQKLSRISRDGNFVTEDLENFYHKSFDSEGTLKLKNKRSLTKNKDLVLPTI